MRVGSRVSTWKPLPHLKLGLTHRIETKDKGRTVSQGTYQTG